MFDYLIPKEMKEGLRKGVFAVVVAILSLLAGSLLLLVIGVLREASAWSQFGMTGILSVVGFSAVISAFVWFRSSAGNSPQPGRKAGRAKSPIAIPPPLSDAAAGSQKPVHKAPVIPPPLAETANAKLSVPQPPAPPLASDGSAKVTALKAEFVRALDAGRLEEAAGIVSQVRALGEEKWSDQATRQIEYKRRRQ